ncbi:MAG: hypothetical protein KDK76_01365 [Chlamydiia bacterium]|nr:hypothetical protein [Chlamydiia bacterium]
MRITSGNIINREEAIRYRDSLSPENSLCNELAQKLIMHKAGIFELSNGCKINATEVRLKGGFFGEVGATLLRIATSDQVHQGLKTTAKGIWNAIFLKEISGDEQKDKQVVVDQQAKLEAVKSSEEKDKLINYLTNINANLMKATSKDGFDRDDALEALNKVPERIDTFKSLLDAIRDAKLDSGSETQEKTGRISSAFDQTFQNVANLINLNNTQTGNHNTQTQTIHGGVGSTNNAFYQQPGSNPTQNFNNNGPVTNQGVVNIKEQNNK